MKPFSLSRIPATLIVDYRWYLVSAVFLITVILAALAPGMRPDPTMKSGIDTDSPAYRRYEKFMKVFGNEEFILIAVKTVTGASDPAVLQAVENMSRELEGTKDIIEVISLTSPLLFQDRGGKFGNYPLVVSRGGVPRLPDPVKLEKIREKVPIVDLLLSRDLKTVGMIFKVSEESRLDSNRIKRVLDRMDAVVLKYLPKGADHRIIGAPVIVQAIQTYNRRTALTFGILCSLISALISIYIFKSLRVAGITLVVVTTCVVWIIGLMVLAGIRLNSTTALSFGLILIVTVAAVVHIVTHYNERFRYVGNRVEAARQAIMIVGRPCLMCALTTGAGFASIMISSIPMVRQLGFIMALGVLISYILALILTPSLLILMARPSKKVYQRMDRDGVSVLFARMEQFVFSHPRLCVGIGFLIMVMMVVGVPRIRSETQILRMLKDSTKEVQDIHFVEENLTPIQTLELLVEVGGGAFKNPAVWAKVRLLEQRLKEIPEVVRTESLLSVLEYLQGAVSEPGTSSEKLFTDPDLVPQLLAVMSIGNGSDILKRYVDDQFSKIRISVRIRNSSSTPVGATIKKVRSVARDVFAGLGYPTLTGGIALFYAQGAELVRAQIISLIIALSSITLLLVVQFRSLVLGLLSLIPNTLPLAAIFGIMGWFNIPLDNVTIFAATISIGLSVDDTIHYLTQLQREIRSHGPTRTVETCLTDAYGVTGKALISTSAVLFFGFLVLVWSPFQPVISFGVLGSSAIIAALFGDLVFMPSIILSFSP
ncbi:MAG: MMPL family transporter, partial [Deltaproteobacteria bacterium]